MISPSIRRTSRLSGAVVLTVAQAVVLGLGYVTHILIGKLGGPPLYGIYGVALSIQTILNMLLTLGIPVALSKEVAEDDGNSGAILKTGFLGQLGISLLLALLTVLIARPLALLLGDETLTPIIRFTAIIYPATGLYALYTNYFNGLHAFALQAGLVVLYAVAKLTGSVGLLAAGYGVLGALSGFAIGGAITALLGFFLARETTRGRSVRRVPLSRLVRFAGAFVGTTVALQVVMSLDLFLVKRILHDNTLTGYYNAATTLARIPYFILQALGFVFLPSVARLMLQDPAAARNFIRKIFRYLFLLLLPATVLAATTSKALLTLFFSHQYSPAAQPLTLLMIALGLLSAFYLFSTIAAGAGKPRVPLLISWLLIPLGIVTGAFLIPRLGLEGAALTTILSSTFGTAVLGAYMVIRFRLTFPLPTLIRGTLATVVMAIPTYLIVLPTTLLLPLEYAALGILYILTLTALGEMKRGDLKYIRALLPKSKGAGNDASLSS